VGLRIPVRARRRILRKINRSVKRADGEDEVLYVDEADIALNKVRLTVARRGRHKR